MGCYYVTSVDLLASSHLIVAKTTLPVQLVYHLKIRNTINIKKIKNNYLFTTFDVEFFGPWSLDAKLSYKKFSKLLQSTSKVEEISRTIERDNADSILSTLPSEY